MSKAAVEICVNSRDIHTVSEAVDSAYIGGASYIELCSDMRLGGTTPPKDHILEARRAFRERNGLMVMIRPRGGDFYYSENEIETMIRQIKTAAEAGADGVVLGVLSEKIVGVNKTALERLTETAKENELIVGFHRAIDAARDPVGSLDILIEAGVDRVLTAGIPWGQKGTAIDGIPVLRKMIEKSAGKIEIVIGGGISPGNAGGLHGKLPTGKTKIVLHSYSGVMKNGKTDPEFVKELVKAADSLYKDQV
ncbi:copper homeostasis protein CutC [candidate division KSB1 bacterium]